MQASLSRALGLRGLVIAGPLAVVVGYGCGGKIVEKRLARGTVGTIEGPEDDAPGYEPPLVPIIATDSDGEDAAGPADASACSRVDGGCGAGCCGAVIGFVAHPERSCHEAEGVLLDCVARQGPPGATGECAPLPAVSCVAAALEDGGGELFYVAATWPEPDLADAGLGTCVDASAASMSAVCP